MKLRKISTIMLSVVMLTAVLTGCNQTAESPFVTDPIITESPAEETEDVVSPAALNFAGAYAAMDPKTALMTINGNDVTWDEFFYYISYNINYIQTQGGPISDWSANYQDALTYKDSVLNSALKIALETAAIQFGSDQLDVTLSAQDQTAIQAAWDSQVEAAGSEEALLARLEEGFVTKDLFLRLTSVAYLENNCFASMYGDMGSKLSDQEVADYTAEDGYLMAKHILFMTGTPDETGKLTPMTDANKAKVRDKAETALTALKNYKGDDFDAYFDELMNKDSEDKGGLSQFPTGYLFQEGDMYTEFYDAVKALDVGDFGAIIETGAGYHIVYRIPINYDVTPILYSDFGEAPLRYIAARSMFNSVVDTWLTSLNIVYSDQYKSLDFDKLFAAG